MPTVLPRERRPDRCDPLDRWRDTVSHAFVPMHVQAKEPQAAPGQITSTRLGPLRICRVQAGPQTVSRDQRLITRSPQPPCLIVTLQERGTSTKQQDDRESVIRPGEFSITDSSRSFRKRLDTDFRFTSFCVPRSELRVTDTEVRALTATALRAEGGSAALVSSFLARLAQEAPLLDDRAGRRVASTALDLLTLLIDELHERTAPPTASAPMIALERVKQYALAHLADPDLSAARIADAHNMSVRYVHKLFELDGTTAGTWIRTQRLQRCSQDLLRPSGRELGVAAVGRRWGFESPSSFSRAFRNAFGVSPRTWQAIGGTALPHPVPEGAR